MRIEYRTIKSGPLIYYTKVVEKDLLEIEKLCNKNIKNDFRQNLAGVLDEEFSIDNIKIDHILNPYLQVFTQAHENWYQEKNNFNLKCISAWVNYMHKGDSNPLHVHLDCSFSSVLFLQFPNEIIEEQKQFKGSASKPGNINFVFNNHLPFHINYYEHTPSRGDFFMFPANVYHQVPSFHADCERISVACNFLKEVRK